MHAQLEELWIDAMEMKVGEQITTYLRKNHPEYQEIEARQKKLIEDYPMLWKVNTIIIMDNPMYSLMGAC